MSTGRTRARSIIDLNHDVLALICETMYRTPGSATVGRLRLIEKAGLLRRFSTTCRLARSVALPILFRVINIRKKTPGEATLIMHCLVETGLVAHIRDFNFLPTMSTSNLAQDNRSLDLPSSIEDFSACAEVFVELVNAVPALGRLKFDPNPNWGTPFVEAFRLAFAAKEPRLRLDYMKRLTIQSCYTYIRAVCPNLTSLTIRMSHLNIHDPDVWRTGGDKVTELAIMNMVNAESHGREKILDDIAAAMLSVAVLSLQTHPGSKLSLALDLTRFRHFRSLIRLNLPGPSQLDPAYNPPRCANAWRGLSPEEAQEVRQRYDDAANCVCMGAKRTARAIFPHLQQLQIGSELWDLRKLQSDSLEDLDRLEKEDGRFWAMTVFT